MSLNAQFPTSISPDGTHLVFGESTASTSEDILMMTMDDKRATEPRIHTKSREFNPEISPNGRWIAYESDESGRREIYVRPFPAVDTGRWQISTTGGTKPVWSRNGKELFFVSLDGQLMAVAVETAKDLTYGRQTPLFKTNPYYVGQGPTILNGRTYDVAPDGRFLLIKEPPTTVSTAPTIVVVEHWIDEVRKRLGQ